MNYSRFEIIGHLTRDPEAVEVGDALKAIIRVAVNRTWTDFQGEAQEETDFFTVEAWRGLAETFRDHLREGRLVFVAGHMRQDSWETEEGESRSRVRFVAREFRFLDRKASDPQLAAGEGV